MVPVHSGGVPPGQGPQVKIILGSTMTYWGLAMCFFGCMAGTGET